MIASDLSQRHILGTLGGGNRSPDKNSNSGLFRRTIQIRCKKRRADAREVTVWKYRVDTGCDSLELTCFWWLSIRLFSHESCWTENRRNFVLLWLPVLDCRSHAHVYRITPRCAIHMAEASQVVIDICVNFFPIFPQSDVSQGPFLQDNRHAGLGMDSALVSGRGSCYAELSD